MIKSVVLVALLLVVGIGAILILAAMRPETFEVERTATIAATPERIFPLINDLQSFRQWSPYETKDPDMQRVFSGPSGGKGAIYDWDGDKNVGKGRLTIVDATPPSKVTIDLHMQAPFESRNVVEFTLAPRGGATDVTWAMHGPAPFPAKVVHVLFDMDKMVGGDFEAGLAKLKALAEK